MPVEVSYLAVVTLEGQIVIQMRGPGRKHGQLHLRHGMDLPVATTPCQSKSAQLNSSRPAKTRSRFRMCEPSDFSPQSPLSFDLLGHSHLQAWCKRVA